MMGITVITVIWALVIETKNRERNCLLYNGIIEEVEFQLKSCSGSVRRTLTGLELLVGLSGGSGH